MIEEERDVDTAYSKDGPKKRRASTADYRLAGRITSLDAVHSASAKQSRYHLFVFELINLRNNQIAWTDKYEFKKAGQPDVVYR